MRNSLWRDITDGTVELMHMPCRLLCEPFQFVEGSIEEVDAYCADLQRSLGVERPFASAGGGSIPQGLCDEIEGMHHLARSSESSATLTAAAW